MRVINERIENGSRLEADDVEEKLAALGVDMDNMFS